MVVTKLDRDRSSFERTLDQLRDSFGKAIAPIQVPIGSEEFRGVVRAPPARLRVHGGEKSGKEVDLPSEVEDLVHAAHTALVETVVETDDEMMEAYFEGKEPSREQIVATIHKGIVAGDIQPVLVASAETHRHRPARRVHRRLRAQSPGAHSSGSQRWRSDTPVDRGADRRFRVQICVRPLRWADISVSHLLGHREGGPGARSGLGGR